VITGQELASQFFDNIAAMSNEEDLTLPNVDDFSQRAAAMFVECALANVRAYVNLLTIAQQNEYAKRNGAVIIGKDAFKPNGPN
jgi:myo-inositol-1-phosphate synthase